MFYWIIIIADIILWKIKKYFEKKLEIFDDRLDRVDCCGNASQCSDDYDEWMHNKH